VWRRSATGSVLERFHIPGELIAVGHSAFTFSGKSERLSDGQGLHTRKRISGVLIIVCGHFRPAKLSYILQLRREGELSYLPSRSLVKRLAWLFFPSRF